MVISSSALATVADKSGYPGGRFTPVPDADEPENAVRAEVAHRRALDAFGQGDYFAAVAGFNAALALRPEYAEAYNGRGVARYCLKDFAAAVADFDAALEIHPEYGEAYNNRGMARKAQGDIAAALADYEQVLRLQPEFAQAYNNRGSLRQSQNDREGALADYDKAIELNPTYAEAYENRAGLHYITWRHAEAVADFNRAFALYRHSSLPAARLCRLFIGRGDARYHSGDPHGLLSDYHSAMQMHTDVAAAVIVQRVADDMRVGRACVIGNCRKHLQQFPKVAATRARWSLILTLSGKDDEAATQFKQFRALTPQYAAYLERLLTEATRLAQVRSATTAEPHNPSASIFATEPEREPGKPV